jgi:hypothetical protein
LRGVLQHSWYQTSPFPVYRGFFPYGFGWLPS